jgi:nucleoside-diphosphate-sugar epimerase
MVFVTGGTGFLGAHLIYHLLFEGKHVIALKRETSKMDLFNRIFSFYQISPEHLKGTLKWVDGDILNMGQMDEMIGMNITEIYHAAAIVSFQPHDRADMFRSNINGTANLVNAALNKNIRKFCHVSSIAAIGRGENQKSIDETTLWKASRRNSNYAISKYGAEREVWRGIEEGLPAVIINPSVILGPGEIHSGTGKMISVVLKGLKFYSEGCNGFVDVRDVAAIMKRLTESDISGERFIVSAENQTYHEIFSMIATETGQKPPYFKATQLMGQLAWRLSYLQGKLTGTKPLITRETAVTAGNTFLYSNQKIAKTLNHQFIPVNLSIRDACRFYLDNTNLK